MTLSDIARPKPRKFMICLYLDEEEKQLVERAASEEGLEPSGFMIVLLVRRRILSRSSLHNIKRKPVRLFDALHSLLSVLNRIGGNCKQLDAAIPDIAGLHETHHALIRANAVISDFILPGRSIPAGINLYWMLEGITKEDHRFNVIVKKVHRGQPHLDSLQECLACLREWGETIENALSGAPVRVRPSARSEAELIEKAMAEMRKNMKKRNKI